MNKNKTEIPQESNEKLLPDGVKLCKLKENFQLANTEYAKAMRRARKLDMADRNKLWQSIKCDFPTYQILPETNHVSYIKNNILASIYTVGKSASIIPTCEEDKDIVTNLNIAIERIWEQLDVNMYQLRAGERAALLNLGVTQVGWDNNIVIGSKGNFERGRCVLKNIDPMKYMRDPFSESLDTASFVITWDEYHESVIEANPNYEKAFKTYKQSHKASTDSSGGTVVSEKDRSSLDANGRNGYYKVYTHWIRKGKDIHEIHLLNNEYVLFAKERIVPNTFPFAELYCNLPNGDLLGTSEPNKIFANSLAYNLMNSIILTAEYKNQRPPKFVNSSSQLNIASFTKHGNEADRTFIVAGDASKAVHYHQFPTPGASAITGMSILNNDIKNVTGVDDRYTGRDTGSILTTGGVNSMLDQVTMIDTPKIINYENYTKRLTQLILMNYINLSAISRKYFVHDPKNSKQWKTIEVDFPKIDNDTVFSYGLNISSDLPKNKTVVANMANKLMEMQMQYSAQNTEVDLITPQEWLMLQDLPNKEYMLERMGVQRTNNWLEATAQIVSQYAGLIESGVNPEEAIQATAATMQAQTSPQGEGVSDVLNNIQQGGLLNGM